VPGDQHHRAPAGRALDLGHDPGHAVAVEAAGRLVEDQQVRFGDEGLGHQRPLGVAPGQRLQRDRGRVGQAEPAQQVPGTAG
jgi:hypothetical protein